MLLLAASSTLDTKPKMLSLHCKMRCYTFQILAFNFTVGLCMSICTDGCFENSGWSWQTRTSNRLTTNRSSMGWGYHPEGGICNWGMLFEIMKMNLNNHFQSACTNLEDLDRLPVWLTTIAFSWTRTRPHRFSDEQVIGKSALHK